MQDTAVHKSALLLDHLTERQMTLVMRHAKSLSPIKIVAADL